MSPSGLLEGQWDILHRVRSYGIELLHHKNTCTVFIGVPEKKNFQTLKLYPMEEVTEMVNPFREYLMFEGVQIADIAPYDWDAIQSAYDNWKEMQKV